MGESSTDARARTPRSRAWLFGWLGVSGPIAFVAAIGLLISWKAPASLGIFVLTMLLSVVTLFFAIAAIVRARRDLRLPDGARPRLLRSGLALGIAGTAFSGLVVLYFVGAYLSLRSTFG